MAVGLDLVVWIVSDARIALSSQVDSPCHKHHTHPTTHPPSAGEKQCSNQTYPPKGQIKTNQNKSQSRIPTLAIYQAPSLGFPLRRPCTTTSLSGGLANQTRGFRSGAEAKAGRSNIKLGGMSLGASWKVLTVPYCNNLI